MSREPAHSVSDVTLDRPSKTRRKREMHELQALGEALASLPDTQLVEIDLPDPLREAIAEWRRTRSHEGRRRQMQYIGKLMRGIDQAPAREAVARAKVGSARDTLMLHRVERWRDVLIADEAAATRFAAEHPDADLATLRRLVRAARTESAQTRERHGRAYRELFKWLKEVIGDE
jgi:ribosome-associated protein